MASQRRQNQSRRQRIANRSNRIYRSRIQQNIPINNESTLRDIANLPEQATADDPLIFQFFNGCSF